MRRTWMGVVGLLGFVFAGPARADVAPLHPPGQHWQAATATVAPGSTLPAGVRLRRVQQGDTLGGLARTHLGAFERWVEIRDLNPGTDPKQLRVGSLLRIPPRERSEEEANIPLDRTWILAAVRESMAGDWTWLEPSRHLTLFVPEGRRLVALRVDRAPQLFEGALKFAGTLAAYAEALDPADRAALAIADHDALAGGYVEDDDPAWRLDQRYTATAVTEGSIRLEKTGVDRYDANGKLLPRSEDSSDGAAAGAREGGPAAPARWDLVLAFLAILGAAGLGVVYLRRRAEDGAGTDSALSP